MQLVAMQTILRAERMTLQRSVRAFSEAPAPVFVSPSSHLRSKPIPATTSIDIGALTNVANASMEEVMGVLKSSSTQLHDPARLRHTEITMERLMESCRQFEAERSASDLEEIYFAREQVRKIVKPFVSAGPLGREITEWPRGPGSSTAMKILYEGMNLPTTSPASHYSEWYLRTRDLSHAVRSRKDTLRDLLQREIMDAAVSHPEDSIDILDLANGPVQSLKDLLCGQMLSPAILKRIQYLGFDTDASVQEQNKEWIREYSNAFSADPDSFNFEVASALSAPFRDDQARKHDVIYSTGFYDYLPDQKLTELWKKSFETLKPDGSLVISLKDSDKYHATPYHYLVSWDHFWQRNQGQFENLLVNAGLPPPLHTIRDATGIIIFYIVRKPF